MALLHWFGVNSLQVMDWVGRGKKVGGRLVQPYRQKQGVQGPSQPSRKCEEWSWSTVVMSWRWPGELDCWCRAGVSNWTGRGEGSSKVAFRQTRQWTQKLALCSLWWVFERAVEQVHLIKWYVSVRWFDRDLDLYFTVFSFLFQLPSRKSSLPFVS